MDSDEFEGPEKGSALAGLANEDIDALSVDELRRRVALLRAEIERTEARIRFSADHKANADALFRK